MIYECIGIRSFVALDKIHWHDLDLFKQILRERQLLMYVEALIGQMRIEVTTLSMIFFVLLRDCPYQKCCCLFRLLDALMKNAAA